MEMTELMSRVRGRLSLCKAHAEVNRQVVHIADQVAEHALMPAGSEAPVLFFNASTRLTGLSLNAAFSLLTSWSLRLHGTPIVNFVCTRGMSQCVLGTQRSETSKNPPCASCISQSNALFVGSERINFHFSADPELEKALRGQDLDGLMAFQYEDFPLGQLVLPSARWILRRHHLQADPITLRILRDYIRSAWSVKVAFEKALESSPISAVVVFNGMQYPEATVRLLARQKGLPVYSHEVGLRPFSAFFTEGDATAYPLSLPADFQLNKNQLDQVNAYLSARFKGNFHMAGVKFWPEISALDADFLKQARAFKQVVPVFTNVIFDTSQPHANVLFEDMFVWLDEILKTAKSHPETLFVIRAHPDETRQGKASEESVSDWAQRQGVAQLPNVRFIPPQEYVSSYDLIGMAKFVLVYNSTIGLEASILGAAVLSAGKSRYTAADVVFMPADKAAYAKCLESLLTEDEIEVPKRFKTNGLRFLYWQLYRASLSFEDFLEADGIWPGYVKLRNFNPSALLPENSPTLKTITEGIRGKSDFILREDV